MKTITVTGAGCQIGHPLSQILLNSGVQVRAVSRNAARISTLIDQGAHPAVGTMEDKSFVIRSFAGADAVFAMLPPHPDAPDMRAGQDRIAVSIREAIEAAQIQRVVMLSSIGATIPEGTGPVAGLHSFEEMLTAVQGVNLVILRPAFFMENFLSFIPLIKERGVIGTPLRKDLPLAMIATRDIAAIAAGYLKEPSFSGLTIHELPGPRDYTLLEAASILGDAVGSPNLEYREFSCDEAREAMEAAGFSPSVASGYMEMYRAFNSGIIQKTLSSRPPADATPTTLEEFAGNIFADRYNAHPSS